MASARKATARDKVFDLPKSYFERMLKASHDLEVSLQRGEYFQDLKGEIGRIKDRLNVIEETLKRHRLHVGCDYDGYQD
jgi:hypothetical protein